MFRGEPIALQTILTGLLLFSLTQIFGLFMPGVLIASPSFTVRSSHFLLAFLGWLGFVIFGAQLQFFRAISNVRRYEPLFLRPIYQGSLLIGLFLLIISQLFVLPTFVYFGLFTYAIAIIIHCYWLLPQIRSKLFKFPLNYLMGSHLFFMVAYILIIQKALVDPLLIADNFLIIHILGIGWISMNLQGAMLRILPMFVGKAIDRKFRNYVDYNFWVTGAASILLLAGMGIGIIWLTILGSILWVGSWIWVIIVLISSIFSVISEIQFRITLGFFVPGVIFLSLGTFYGFQDYYRFFDLVIPRGVHIHLTLLAGISVIMMGAIHRITSFQIFTLLYTGRREEARPISDFLHTRHALIVILLVTTGPLLLTYGFFVINSNFIIAGAFLNLIGVLFFTVLIFNNYIFYLRHRHQAIPYWLKPSEVSQ